MPRQPQSDEDENELEDVAGGPTIPEYWMDDDEVEAVEFDYSTRHPSDWVISGPLGKVGGGPGRRFASWSAAEKWAREFYGKRLRGRVPEAANSDGNRWAFLIKGPRGER